MTEIEFEKIVVELAHMFGWIVASFRPAQTGKGWRTPVKYDGKGYPDLTLVHAEHGEIIFTEIKSDTGRIDPAQVHWGAKLARCTTRNEHVRYFVWRPKDLPEITRILSFGRAAA